MEGCLELVSEELNHLAAILRVYAGGLIFMIIRACDFNSVMISLLAAPPWPCGAIREGADDLE